MSLQPPATITSCTSRCFLRLAHARRNACHPPRFCRGEASELLGPLEGPSALTASWGGGYINSLEPKSPLTGRRQSFRKVTFWEGGLMGRRGPPRKPTALKVMQGTARLDRTPANEPKPDGTPEPPDFLTAEARVEWDRLASGMEAIGLLTTADRAIFAGYCQAWPTPQKQLPELDVEPDQADQLLGPMEREHGPVSRVGI